MKLNIDNKTKLLIIFARVPEAGKVKTRLAAAVGDEAACEIYRGFTDVTVRRFSGRGYDTRIDYSPSGRAGKDYFSRRYAGVANVPQRGGDLGARMHNAFVAAFKEGYESVCIIGTDSPDLPAGYVSRGFRLLEKRDAVFGPSEDGGYYLIGLSKPAPTLFKKMEWSCATVMEETVRRARDLKMSFSTLPVWKDVDCAEDFAELRERLSASYKVRNYHVLLRVIENTTTDISK